MKPRKISGIIPAWLRVLRKKNSNKSSYGRVLVVAGSDGMAGAAILCSRAALRAGAGLVTVAVPKCIQPVVAACLPEAMTLGLPHSAGKIDGKKASRILTNWLASKGCDLIVAGPGLGQGAGVPALLRQLAGSGKPLLLDADALNVLAKNEKWGNMCRRSLVIITPHPGEAARLLQSSVDKVQQSRRQSVIKLVEICGGIALLKGHRTLVADSKAHVVMNRTGGPELAKGGSGDVLSGLIGGLWAQGGKSKGFNLDTAFQSAVAGAYIHGLCGKLAARELGQKSVLAGDLIEFMPYALSAIVGSKT